MNARPRSYRVDSLFPNLTVLFLGVGCALTLCIAATQGKKCLTAVILGSIASLSLVVFRKNVKQLFTLVAVFAIPIRLDFHLIFKATEYSQLKGLPVSLFDIAFAVLFLMWVRRLMLRRAMDHLILT